MKLTTNFWMWAWKALCNEHGQIPGSVSDEPSTDAPAADEPAPAEPSAEPAADPAPGDPGEPAAKATDTFFDPKTLPPELQVHWKKMQGAYTKRMQQAADWRQKAELVDRFNTDPSIRRQIFQQYQAELAALQGQTPTGPGTQTPAAGAPPAEFVKAFRDNLPPELQWMAESQAKSVWAAQQMAMAPYVQQLQNQQVNTRASEWDQMAEQMPPGWEEHEDEMAEVLDFLESPSFKHPVYGNKLQLLYRLVTGDATAATQAIERMGAAAQNRMVGRGGQGQRVEQNLTDRIMKTRSIRDAVQLAGRAAMEKMESQGARFDG